MLIADRHNTFERVLQECIILHLACGRDSPTHPYLVNARAITVPADLNSPEGAFSITSDRVLLGDEYDGSFYIGTSEFEYQVFERMNSVGVKLSESGLKAETGKIQFDKYREYAQSTGANGACRLIWAENVQRYAHRKSSKRVGKEWLDQEIRAIIPPTLLARGS